MSNSKLYVGNLNYATTSEELKELFANHGTVSSANVIERKGFGFIEMSTPEEAIAAKEALNGTEFAGRNIKVDEAKPPRNKDQRNGGGFNRNRGGGGYSRDRY